MSDEITCPVKKYPGSVVLKPLTFSLFVTWKKCMEQQGEDKLDNISLAHSLLPVLCDCVEEWKLKDFPSPVTAENFPGDKILTRMQVINWLVNEVNGRFFGSDEDGTSPNE